jgi:hypothetical protein
MVKVLKKKINNDKYFDTEGVYYIPSTGFRRNLHDFAFLIDKVLVYPL